MKTILVLGAGTGGVTAAREISKNSGNEEDINLVRILVFEKEEKNVFSPSLPWLMVGKRKPEQIYEKISHLDSSGLEVIQGEIEQVDPEGLKVKVNGKIYKGDYMIISLGVEQQPLPYLEKSGHNFFTLEGANSFNKELKKIKEGKIAILVSSLPFKSPAAPYEAAMLIEEFVRKNHLKPTTEVALYTPEKGPMEFAGKKLSEELRTLLEHKGIKYYPDHQIIDATETSLSFSNGKTYDYTLLAYTPIHQSPDVIRKSSLAGESGWIDVNKDNLQTKFPNVYAIGDNTNITLENGITLPKIGVFARQQAMVVAHNIGRKMGDRLPEETFKGEGQYFIEFGDLPVQLRYIFMTPHNRKQKWKLRNSGDTGQNGGQKNTGSSKTSNYEKNWTHRRYLLAFHHSLLPPNQ